MTSPADAFAFLTSACRAWLGTEPGTVNPDPALDAKEVGRLSFLHGLDPLLFRLVDTGTLETGLLGPLVERWEETYFKNHVFNTEAIAILGRLLDESERTGIPVMAFKGPVTLARGYCDPGLRIMADLDLLCREGDLGPLCRLASRHGFSGAEENSIYHLSLFHRERQLGLELHFDLYDFLRNRTELLARLLETPDQVEVEGAPLAAPPPELALVLDVAHLVQHDFRVNLRRVLDIAALMQFADPPLDGAELSRGGRDVGLEPELLLTLLLVEDLFGVRPPPGIRGSRESSEISQEELLGDVDRVRRRLPEGESAPVAALTGLAAHRGLAAKLGYLRRILFPPRDHLTAETPRPKGSLSPRARHLHAVFERGRRKWRAAGLADSNVPSIKQRVYERRRTH